MVAYKKHRIRFLLHPLISVLWVVFPFFLGASFPDSEVQNNLLRVLDTTKGTGRVDVLNQLSLNAVYTSTTDALDYARSAFKLARRMKYRSGESMALNRSGVAYDVLGRYDSALAYYYNAMTLSKTINDSKLSAGILNNIGLTHWHIGNANDACKYFFQALTYFELDKNTRGLANVNNNIGMVYKSIGNYDKAIVFLEKAHHLYKELEDKPGTGAVLTNIGQTYIFKNNFTKALEYLIRSVEIKNEIEDNYGLSISYNHLATLYMEAGDYNKALGYSYKAAEYGKMIDSEQSLADAYLKTAAISILDKQYDKAHKYNLLAEGLAARVKSDKLLLQVYHNWADIFEARGEFKKSLEYFKKYKETEDNVFSGIRYNQIYELELKHETAENEMEIALLNRQKRFQLLQIEAQELLISKRNTQIILIITAALVILLIWYNLYINYKHKHKIRLEDEYHKIKESRANELLAAEINERKRIGEELHDGLGQILSVLKLTLTSLEKKLLPDQLKQQELVENAVSLTDNAFGELRNISHNLAPIFLQEKGLVASIRNLLEPLQESKKFKVNMEFSEISNQIDNFTELTIYRVVQEAVNNILVHSGAKEINFQLLENDEELILMIEDDGVGFDINENKDKKGIGLNNIHSRIENIGGNVHIDTALSRGTIITIIIPLKQLQHG